MIHADVIPYALPFVRPIRLGDVLLRARTGWLLRISDNKGNVGWGEASPLPGFSRETAEQAERDLMRVPPRIARGDFHPGLMDCSSVRFALELATADLAAHRKGLTLAKAFHPFAREKQSLNAVLLADEPVDEAHSAVRAGYRALKMKVGHRSVVEDSNRVRSVIEAVGDRASVRLDANRAWSDGDAERFWEMVHDLPIEYVEEPLSNPAGLRRLAIQGMPVAIDESVVGLDPNELRRMNWLKAAVLKPTIIGGIRKAKVYADRALKAGIKPVISSSMETGIGLRALAALAASIGNEDVPAGLDTGRLMMQDTTDPRFSGAPSLRTDQLNGYAVING
ncbi:MAG: o-succinylbenzoate synthase [Rhodothermales bacterium]|nr:o-succinylbenzoate synthase [Rhodothermales bacterium]MBO6779609.1 o-succinylbenzoate synthase [Rhodothermales bacterium]